MCLTKSSKLKFSIKTLLGVSISFAASPVFAQNFDESGKPSLENDISRRLTYTNQGENSQVEINFEQFRQQQIFLELAYNKINVNETWMTNFMDAEYRMAFLQADLALKDAVIDIFRTHELSRIGEPGGKPFIMQIKHENNLWSIEDNKWKLRKILPKSITAVPYAVEDRIVLELNFNGSRVSVDLELRKMEEIASNKTRADGKSIHWGVTSLEAFSSLGPIKKVYLGGFGQIDTTMRIRLETNLLQFLNGHILANEKIVYSYSIIIGWINQVFTVTGNQDVDMRFADEPLIKKLINIIESISKQGPDTQGNCSNNY
ncbi:MAG: hypothetical protein AB8E15_01140 [Bdellovibrionales bacterium]